jgi:parallel beta-helix repeat protein
MVIFLLSTPAARAATYVVSPSGDDNANGTAENPWKTLQHAADRVAAGDTVQVRAGTYVGFDLRTRGTATAPIVFVAEPGARITQRNAVTPDGINLENTGHVVIQGFEVVGAPRAGIRAALCNNVTLRGNRADQNGRWGIFTGFCDDLLIEDNECSRSVVEHGIYVSNSGDRPVIRRNRLWGNHANGVHMNGDVSQGGDGIISGALVEQNVIYENGVGGGSGINCDGVQGSTFRNNLVYENHASGISLYRIDGAAGSRNNVVVNNTIIPASNGRWSVNIKGGSTGNVVVNNILLNRNTGRGSIDIAADSLPGFVSDYNLVSDRFTPDDGSTFVTLAQWRASTGQDTHSSIGAVDATFVNAAGNDYHLSATSPALDRGEPARAPPADLEGNIRPLGAGVDLGAYERCPDTSCPRQGTDDGGVPGPGGMDGGPGSDGGTGNGPPRGCGCQQGGPAAMVAAALFVLALARLPSRRR